MLLQFGSMDQIAHTQKIGHSRLGSRYALVRSTYLQVQAEQRQLYDQRLSRHPEPSVAPTVATSGHLYQPRGRPVFDARRSAPPRPHSLRWLRDLAGRSSVRVPVPDRLHLFSQNQQRCRLRQSFLLSSQFAFKLLHALAIVTRRLGQLRAARPVPVIRRLTR